MCFFICIWINGWVNNREAGDLRCYRAHYDVTVMSTTYLDKPHNVTACAVSILHIGSNLRVLKVEYSWRTSPMPCLLLQRVLAYPGHWFYVGKMSRWIPLGRNSTPLSDHLNVQNWPKMQISYFSSSHFNPWRSNIGLKPCKCQTVGQQYRWKAVGDKICFLFLSLPHEDHNATPVAVILTSESHVTTNLKTSEQCTSSDL